MSITPSDLIALAQTLAQNPDEVASRSAISRAYYGAYHHCTAWHNTFPAPGSAGGKPGGMHQQLINALAQPAPETSKNQPATAQKAKMLSQMLKQVKVKRTQADYDLQDHFTSADALTHIANCQKIVAKAV